MSAKIEKKLKKEEQYEWSRKRKLGRVSRNGTQLLDYEAQSLMRGQTFPIVDKREKNKDKKKDRDKERFDRKRRRIWRR